MTQKEMGELMLKMSEQELRQNQIPLNLRETISRLAGDLDVQKKLC